MSNNLNIRIVYEPTTIRHIAVQCPFCEKWFNGKVKTNSNGIKCKMYPGSTDVETTDLVNGLYSAAKEWYGIEYDQRLRDTINGTLFYECGENESCIDIEERFLGIKIKL